MADKKTLTVLEKLNAIQVELKAPKNLYNSFGKYHYRNAEGIQEALKPLEKTYGVITTLSDTIEEVGGRVYVKATATLIDIASGEMVTVSAYAREASEKKGMDDAQITGATSSYARKYALNGLFLLDDTKDVDTEEYQTQANAEPKRATQKKTASAPAPSEPVEVITEPNYRAELSAYIKANGLDQNEIIKACHLRPDSTNEEWAGALIYAKRIVGGAS